MESVAIATTSRSLPLPFYSIPLHRHRRRSSFLPVAASKRSGHGAGGERRHGEGLDHGIGDGGPARRCPRCHGLSSQSQRTTRAINPHAYTDGTVFVQCCGCNIFHKLVDNLNLFHEMKCYVGPDFHYEGDAPFL